VNPIPGWPQTVTQIQWTLQFSTATGGHPETDPLGFPAGSFGNPGVWSATNMLPLAALSPVCSVGMPVTVQYGSSGVMSDVSDFEFDPANARMSTGGQITVID
jgi:hypothetical protein